MELLVLVRSPQVAVFLNSFGVLAEESPNTRTAPGTISLAVISHALLPVEPVPMVQPSSSRVSILPL